MAANGCGFNRSIYDMNPELVDERISAKVENLGYMPAQDGFGVVEDCRLMQRVFVDDLLDGL